MRLIRLLSAGFLDAGLASLAMFAVGVEAARRLDPAALGGYALVFAVFLLATVLPAQLVFLPAEVRASTLPAGERLSLLGSALRYGVPVAAAASCAVVVVLPVLPDEVPGEVVAPLVLTAGAAALVSPVQDHLRRLLHVAGASSGAAVVSGVQLVTVTAVLALLAARDVPGAWAPFSALAAANTASSVAAFLCLRRLGGGPRRRLGRRELGSGGWLLLVGLAPAGAGFLAAALIGATAGATALGHAEAARVVAQPLLVVGMGLGAVLGPRSVAAAAAGEERTRRRVRLVFAGVLAVVAVLALALLGHGWGGNPVQSVLPDAYAVPGLVALTLVANALNGAAFPYRYELLGLRAEGAAARGEVGGALLQVAASLTAGATGAFARPLGLLALAVGRLALFRRALAQHAAAAGSAPDGCAD